jgi:hypothetical protein
MNSILKLKVSCRDISQKQIFQNISNQATNFLDLIKPEECSCLKKILNFTLQESTQMKDFKHFMV